MRRETRGDQSSAYELGQVDSDIPEPIQDSHAWPQIKSHHPQRNGIGSLPRAAIPFGGPLNVDT